MAVLKLTLEGVDLQIPDNGSYKKVDTISLSTGTDSKTIKFKVSENSYSEKAYNLNLVNCKFQKKMYQPTEIIADLQINMAEGATWTSIGRTIIESTFKHKQVKLAVGSDSIGTDFYVHEVLPCYKKDSMVVKLKIYSLDKLLTLDKSCYSYVAKKLVSDIIKPKIAGYKKPYEVIGDEKKELGCSEYGSSSDYDNSVHLQVLRFVTKKEEKKETINGKEEKRTVYTYEEHIFPYLVQYNESFYDMLIRTCNRWGEFVFWENGKLNIGYDSTKPAKTDSNGNKSYEYKTIPDDYKTLTFPNIDKTSTLVTDNSQYYFPVGADDSTIRDTNAQKSKWYAKAKLLAPGGMGDMYWMQKFNQFFLNNKNWASFLATTFAEDIVDWGKEEAAVSDRNKDYNGKYFPDSGKKDGTTAEQYGKAMFKGEEKDGMNEFTEINTAYDDAKYKEILKYELKAMENVVEIDYDTTWPGLKLGEIIKKDGETFIVVEVDCEKNSENSPVFRILAIGSFKFTDENNNTTYKFYPSMLPTGHVRYSGPQKATVQEASSDDPCDQNRVRVAFPWQMKDQTTWIGDLSPRIRIASSDGGANMASMFYVGDSVMIGYIDGNIERPYVLGSIPKIGTVMNNVHMMSTPGGHALNLTDGSGEGLVKFMSNAILPVYNSLAGWLPSSISSNVAKWAGEWDKNKYFEGGFTLSDKYGIYRINGSTDGRRITIMSPWGDVMINAFTGINIMAPNGDVNIVGKNVSIAAGNKLSLTSGTNIAKKLKGDTKGKQTLDWLENIPAAIAEALTKKYFKLLDLSLVRSAVDIVLRPVEGTLTLKSMRFMKLEAGMRTRCDFPAVAYKKKVQDKTQQQKDKQTLNAITSIGAVDQTQSLAFGTIEVFKKLFAFADKLVNDYIIGYIELKNQKLLFELEIAELQRSGAAVNSANPVCSTYNELKNDFWADGEYQEWSEDKLGFNEENVGIDPDSTPYSPTKYWETLLSKSEYLELLRTERTSRRKRILDFANKLRKMICEFSNFDVTMDMVNATFSELCAESLPADFKEKIKTAASKAKCPNAIIYQPLTSSEKNLNIEFLVLPIEKKYLKRLIIYNLLIALGFDEDSRCEIKLNEEDEYTRAIDEPDTNDLTADGDRSLMNDVYWNQYVQSLSGVPVIEKQTQQPGVGKTIAKGVGKAALDASGISTAMSFAELRNHSIWGEGKDGRVLIGADGKTFEFKNNRFSEIQTIEPSSKYYTADSAGLKEVDKANLIGFMNTLKSELSRQ